MPAATNTFDIVKQNATVDDTLRTIVNAVNQCKQSAFIQQVVAEISKLHNPQTDKLGFIRELFAFICRNLTYKLDINGIEEVWTPELTMREKIYDCKKGSVFIASVLAAAGIEPILKHVYYASPGGGVENWTHIYTIVPNPDTNNYITVDTTNDCRFNTEVNYKTGTLYFLNGKKMELHMMGNSNAVQTLTPEQRADLSAQASLYQVQLMLNEAPYSVEGISGSNQYFSFTNAQAFAHTAATVALFPSRAAFLGLLYLGGFLRKTSLKLHWGKRLAEGWQVDKNKIRKGWWLMGGTADASALQKAIIAGSGISISGLYHYGNDRPGLFQPGMNGAVIGEAVTAAGATAAIAVAVPVVTALTGVLIAIGTLKKGQQDPPQPEDDTPPPTPPPIIIPSSGSMMDFSSPINTIMKSILLSTASGCLAGINFYILNGFCTLAILISIVKIFLKR